MMIPDAAKRAAIELLYGRYRRTRNEEDFLRSLVFGRAHTWTKGQREYFDALARRFVAQGRERRL